MFQRFFSYDGKLMDFLNKLGEIILLNIVFLICCVPIVTAGSALTSFYYAMIKSVRRERGSGPIREFMSSMKRTLGRGVLMTIGIIAWMALLFLGRQMAGTGTEDTAAFVSEAESTVTFQVVLYGVAIVVSICVLIYIFPVFSRFEMKMTQIIKLSFVMCIRFLPVTVAVAVGSTLIGWLLIYWLPVACILVVPGIWCYAVTFLMEKPLRHYTPTAKPGEEQWYDE